MHKLTHMLPRSYGDVTAFTDGVDNLLNGIIATIDKAAKMRDEGKRDVALLDASLTLGCLTSYLAGKWKDLSSVNTIDVAPILTHTGEELELPVVWEKLARHLAREPRMYDGDFGASAQPIAMSEALRKWARKFTTDLSSGARKEVDQGRARLENGVCAQLAVSWRNPLLVSVLDGSWKEPQPRLVESRGAAESRLETLQSEKRHVEALRLAEHMRLVDWECASLAALGRSSEIGARLAAARAIPTIAQMHAVIDQVVEDAKEQDCRASAVHVAAVVTLGASAICRPRPEADDERKLAVKVATEMVAALPADAAQTSPSAWLVNAEKEAEQERRCHLVVVVCWCAS